MFLQVFFHNFVRRKKVLVHVNIMLACSPVNHARLNTDGGFILVSWDIFDWDELWSLNLHLLKIWNPLRSYMIYLCLFLYDILEIQGIILFDWDISVGAVLWFKLRCDFLRIKDFSPIFWSSGIVLCRLKHWPLDWAKRSWHFITPCKEKVFSFVLGLHDLKLSQWKNSMQIWIRLVWILKELKLQVLALFLILWWLMQFQWPLSFYLMSVRTWI